MVIIFIIIFVIILVAVLSHVDDTIRVKSSRAVESYDYIKYFKEDNSRLSRVEQELTRKKKEYKIKVLYVSPKGKSTRSKIITVHLSEINYIKAEKEREKALKEQTRAMLQEKQREQKQAEREREKALREKQKAEEKALREKQKAEEKALKEKLKAEKNAEKKALIEQAKAMLQEKQHIYYDKVNQVIDYANNHKDQIIIQGDIDELDKLMGKLFDRTINSIKKIKDLNSEEWSMLDNLISNIYQSIKVIVQKNQHILDYYDSSDFIQIKTTCDSLMASQKEFNEYIEEKAQSISSLFGSRIVRNETVNEDRFVYIRPYKKTITPFRAEVSNHVFSSAENNPMEYIIKYFYPDTSSYLNQIQKLQLLIGELETLREAKQIIENYKKDYQQYLTNVPNYVLENDEDGFYSRLGFANISERLLTVEYQFAYTSNGGMAQRSFSVPMTEETIVDLIGRLENKLTMEAFTSEQRALMTKKLREHIKKRDNYTCKYCENSIYKEPNLLLEVDHILPIAKGGCTIENNLQTLCWKCNRAKSSKII